MTRFGAHNQKLDTIIGRRHEKLLGRSDPSGPSVNLIQPESASSSTLPLMSFQPFCFSFNAAAAANLVSAASAAASGLSAGNSLSLWLSTFNSCAGGKRFPGSLGSLRWGGGWGGSGYVGPVG